MMEDNHMHTTENKNRTAPSSSLSQNRSYSAVTNADPDLVAAENNQLRKGHNHNISKLESMKRQFNIKLGRRTLPSPQKVTGVATNEKLKYGPHHERSEPGNGMSGKSHTLSKPKSEKLSTLSGQKTSSSAALRRDGKSNDEASSRLQHAESSTSYAALIHSSNHKPSNVLNKTEKVNYSHGKAKSRAMQMQLSSSRRQALENVLCKEVQRQQQLSNSSSEFNPTKKKPAEEPHTLPDVSNNKHPPEESNNVQVTAPAINHLPQSSNFSTSQVQNSSDIREKLRQHYKQTLKQKASPRKENPDLGTSTEDQSNGSSGNISMGMASDPSSSSPSAASANDSSSSSPSAASANDSILNRIRQKGPMVAKRLTQQNGDEADVFHPSDQAKQGNETNKSTISSKVACRQGSPRAPRRRSSPVTSGRTSPFAKRGQSPTSRGLARGRNPSPKGRNPSPNRRPPSPNTDGISPYSPEVTTKKVNRVLKARLYLLQQNGPNSFRIGGDSPEHKYLVIVGPQTCNCGRGQFCIHVLFVMLRVFQLEPTSGLLWRRTLKNYEVESLFRSYHERCNSRISPKKRSRVQRLVSHLASGSDKHTDGSSNSDDQSSSKGEEENCPICLLQMVDGESVTVCEVGCRNKLHTHCVNIWAEECKRNGGPLKCPLCRVVWKPADSRGGASMGSLMVEIPPEYAELADGWIQVFGWDMVSFLFSSHPNVRENALRRLSHDITGALLTNGQTSANEERHSDDSDGSPRNTGESLSNSNVSSNIYLASCCAILAMVCSDPEYRVYISALRTLRAMMAYTQCRTEEDVQSLQRLLAPVIETIFIKCADSNRRNVQLSVSTIMELCRGQAGELAVGKELVSGSETLGIGNVSYFVSFLEFDSGPDSFSWQWMLGRLNALGELFREFKSDLNLSSCTSSNIAGSPSSQRLMKIANFAVSCLKNTSQPRVIKMARRIFLQAYTMAMTSINLTNAMEGLLKNLPSDSMQRLMRKINAFKGATDSAEGTRLDLVHSHSDDNLADGDVLDIHSPQAPPPNRYPHSSNPPNPFLPHNWSNSHSNEPHSFNQFPPYPSNSYRMPRSDYRNSSSSGALWIPRSHDRGVINEPNSHHPPSPCTVTHPPTPPPSSVDTANLDAAIEVSLFRPIRCVSPGRDSSKPETLVPSLSDNAFKSEADEQAELFELQLHEDRPLRCFTVADAIAQNSLKPVSITRCEPIAPVCTEPYPVRTPERPTRPSLLSLKSETSAFRDTLPQRPAIRHGGEVSGGEIGTSEGARDRSSSRESSTSSTSCSEDFRKATDRRLSVRELAENINRKVATKSVLKKSSASNLPRTAKGVSLQCKQYTPDKDMDAEEMILSSNISNSAKLDVAAAQIKQARSADDIIQHSKPISLKAAAIERRGTVERYRDGLRHGINSPGSSHLRKSNLSSKTVAEETLPSPSKRSDPQISPFFGHPQTQVVRTPARGILKNSGIPFASSSNGHALSSSSAVSSSSENALTNTDSGIGNELTHDSVSTFSCASRSSKTIYSNHLTSPEMESAGEDTRTFPNTSHPDEIYHNEKESDAEVQRKCVKPNSSCSSRKPKALLHKQLSKSSSLPDEVPSLNAPETSNPRRSEHEDIPSTSGYGRCPSAPAASLLCESNMESQVLFPVKDDSLMENVALSSSSTAWLEDSTDTRRRTPTRKLPTRPKTLAQRKGRRKMKKQLGSQLSSSVEDLDESDHSVAEKTPVTFKSEIGVQTPSHFRDAMVSTPTSSSGPVAVDATQPYEDDLALQCSCRMKIDEEENKLFAHTLAVSYVQDALPLVPHLSFTDKENDIVRCQNEHTGVQHEYKENTQWCKGAQIGLGAFSACYQARDIFTGTLMAVKQVNHIRCSAVEERQVLQVISEEITLMRRLSHPNVVRLHGVTKEGAFYNVFIEWCAGGSVSTLLSHYGPFNEKVIVNYTLQMLRGLAYIHEEQLIHRDIKGANLLVDSTGQRLRISDFGAAARLASKGTGAGEFQGQLLGTIAFMAPEVLRGEQYGRSCDVWSAGCAVTEMATGKPPWEADMHSNHLALIFKIASSPTVPPIPDRLSPAMKDLCRRCLQADPRDRPTASEVVRHPVFIKW